MIDKKYVEGCIDNFNMHLDIVNNEIGKDNGDFDFSIIHLKQSRESIEGLQNVVNPMRQEEHDLTQNVYNRFKDKGFVKTIKF
jgi:hypothetical protein